jgi:hypothetical protein
MSASCTPLDQIREVTPSVQGGEASLETGDRWVRLRLCLICGHVGRRDSSKYKRATVQFRASGHPPIQSFEPGEARICCDVDEVAPAPAR